MKFLITFLVTNLCLASSIVFMHEQNNKKEIHYTNDQGLSSTRISLENEIALYPDIDPSGRKIVYAYGQSVDKLGLKIYDLKEKKMRVIVEPKGLVLHPRFSKNGLDIIFSASFDGKKHEIYRLELKTRALHKVISHEDNDYFFASAAQDNSFYIYQENRKDKSRHIVLKHLVEDKVIEIDEGMSPALSKDQNKIAYTKKVDGNWDIYTYDRITKKIERMTSHKSMDFAPTFDAKGNIIFASTRLNDTFNLHYKSQQGVSALTTISEGTNYSPRVSGDISYQQALLPKIPGEPRSSFGTIYHQGKIYVVGGHQGPEHTYPPESFVGTLDIYDVATKTWKRGADRPHKCHGFSVAAYGNYIYAFGGFAYSKDHTPKWKSLNVVERYNIKENKWETVAHMPRNRSSNVVAQFGDQVYLIGGWDATPKFEDDIDGTFHDEVDVFDLETQTFSTLKERLPLKRRAFTGVVDEQNRKIHLIGGISESGSHFSLLKQVTILDLSTYSFSELTELPFATFAPAAGLLNGKIFVFGGMFKTGKWSYEYVPHIYEYDLKKASWNHTGRYVNEAKGFSQVINYNDQLGILGGHTYLEDRDTPLSTFEIFK